MRVKKNNELSLTKKEIELVGETARVLCDLTEHVAKKKYKKAIDQNIFINLALHCARRSALDEGRQVDFNYGGKTCQ